MKQVSVPLVTVSRGELIESIHRGHIAVVKANGTVLQSAGHADQVVFARSTAKLLQAVPVLATGAAERFGFTEREIALLCASHSGEPLHVDTVYRMLGKMGIDDSYLQCGAHAPLYEPAAHALRLSGHAPKAVHNNCSGKHCGMLALAIHIGAPPENYMQIGHPVQQAMLRAFATSTGVPAEDVRLGIDGCGVPVYGVPLSSLAAAYARFGQCPTDKERKAARDIVRALARYPEMIAGTGRYDTALIRATNGRIIGKMGAEGVFVAMRADDGLALALKIEDGAERALYPAVTEALVQLGWIDSRAEAALASFRNPPVLNRNGRIVGATAPVFRLR